MTQAIHLTLDLSFVDKNDDLYTRPFWTKHKIKTGIIENILVMKDCNGCFIDLMVLKPKLIAINQI